MPQPLCARCQKFPARLKKTLCQRCTPGGQRHGKDKVCPVCQALFYAPRATKRPEKIYCSQACFDQARFAQVQKVCEVCHRTFSVPRSNASRYNVCSMTCRKSLTVYVTCLRCARVFTGERGGHRKYCSETCRRPVNLFTCPICGTVKRMTPTMIQTRRACSFQCYRRHVRPTRPEQFMKTFLEEHGVAFQAEVRCHRFCIDFVVGKIAIEIDGLYWHSKPGVRERDQRKNKALDEAGYTVIRIPEAQCYDREYLKERLKAVIQQPVSLA